jgi:hypothetical protein
MKGRFAVMAACAAALAVVHSAAAAPKIARPTYSVHEHLVSTPFFVVHYARTGPDHPRFMKDDNHNGTPNYIEKLAAAGNKAWLWYVHNGFKPPLVDTGGPDGKLDVYVKRLRPGTFGVTVPGNVAQGGPFIEISSQLDMAHLAKHGSLQQTIAHELFHAFELSYLPNGGIPAWVAEGSALAMQTFVYPKIVDVSSFKYIDHWLDQPWRSLEDQAHGCDHCYGGALFFRFLFGINGKVLPSFFGRMYGYAQLHRRILDGTQPLNETLIKYAHSSLFASFSRFSYDIWRAGYKPASAYTLTATRRVTRTPVRTVVGLSTHYVPIKMPAWSTALGLAVSSAGGPNPDVKLVVGGRHGFAIRPKLRNRGHQKYFSTRFRTAWERRHVELIVTSGRRVGTRYVVALRAY